MTDPEFSLKERKADKDEEFYTCLVVCFVFAFLNVQLIINAKHFLHDFKGIYIEIEKFRKYVRIVFMRVILSRCVIKDV